MTSINCSCCSSGRDARRHRLVLEIGEHESVRDFDRLRVVLASYRSAGIRFAIDDLGEGFATMDLLETAEPEFVKLARSLTMNASRRSAQAAIRYRAEVRASTRFDRYRRRCRERAGERPDPFAGHPARTGLRTWTAHGRRGSPRLGGCVEDARHAASAPSAPCTVARPRRLRRRRSVRTPTVSSAFDCQGNVAPYGQRQGTPPGRAIGQRHVGEGFIDERHVCRSRGRSRSVPMRPSARS